MKRTEFALLVASSTIVQAIPTVAWAGSSKDSKHHKGHGSSDTHTEGATTVTAIEHSTTYTITSEDVAQEYWSAYFPQDVKAAINLNSLGQYQLTASAPAQTALINDVSMVIGVGIKSPNGALLIFEHKLAFSPKNPSVSVDVVKTVPIIKEFWPQILPGHSWVFVNTVTTMTPVDKTVIVKSGAGPVPSPSGSPAAGLHLNTQIAAQSFPVNEVVDPITPAEIAADVVDVQKSLYKKLNSSAGSLIQAPFVTPE